MYLPEPIRRLRHRYHRRLGRWRHDHPVGAPPVQPDAGAAPPDFVGLGAQKAGTTWWFTLMTEHPQLDAGALGRKELDFFAPYWNRSFTQEDVDAYHLHFPTKGDLVRGEWSPAYLRDPWAPACLERAAPEAKLLVLLRDPIERLLSGLTHLTAIGQRISENDVRAAFERGCYFHAVQRVLALYDRSALLVLQYERCRDEPQKQLDRTFAHLGLEAHRVAPHLFGRAINATEVPKPAIEGSALARLREAFRPDVEALVTTFPDVDLSLWPNFRQHT